MQYYKLEGVSDGRLKYVQCLRKITSKRVSWVNWRRVFCTIDVLKDEHVIYPFQQLGVRTQRLDWVVTKLTQEQWNEIETKSVPFDSTKHQSGNVIYNFKSNQRNQK